MKTTNKTDGCAVEDMLADDLLRDPDFEAADEELLAWRDAEVSKLRAKAEKRRAGRKPKPESQRRTIRFSVCFNAAEYREVETFVGSRETGEVLRNLVLEAIARKNAAD